MKSQVTGPSIARIRSARNMNAPFSTATRWTGVSGAVVAPDLGAPARRRARSSRCLVDQHLHRPLALPCRRAGGAGRADGLPDALGHRARVAQHVVAAAATARGRRASARARPRSSSARRRRARRRRDARSDRTSASAARRPCVTVMMSACLPGSRLPMRSPRPSASAPRRVASSSACARRQRLRIRRSTTLCSSAAARIASNMSRSLLLAAPSVPSPARSPRVEPLRHRGDAARELHVALGIVREADAALRAASPCRRRRARRRARRATGRSRRPATSRYRVGDCAVRVLDDLDLVLRLGEVDQQRHAVLVRQRARGLQRRRRRACTARAAPRPA